MKNKNQSITIAILLIAVLLNAFFIILRFSYARSNAFN